MRPLYQKLQRHGFNGDGRTDGLRPYSGLHVTALTGTDARRFASVRAVPQIVTRHGFNGDGRTDGLRPTVRPYSGLHVSLFGDLLVRSASHALGVACPRGRV